MFTYKLTRKRWRRGRRAQKGAQTVKNTGTQTIPQLSQTAKCCPFNPKRRKDDERVKELIHKKVKVPKDCMDYTSPNTRQRKDSTHKKFYFPCPWTEEDP